ncbi:MAG: sugar phosphate isomerase/epimerase [Planctomycetales bacterium]|nr:sugar phosphate isomerase/epimerase [Planctomycetales bacterium]
MAHESIDNQVTRRTMIGGAAALAASALIPGKLFSQEQTAESTKPNSVINGVRIGCITYSYRGFAQSAEDTLKCLTSNGLSETELMDGPIADYTGINFRRGRRRRTGQEAPEETPTETVTPEDREKQLAKCKELRKMFNDAGVNIHIQKCPFGRTTEEIDFNFQIAKALGCKAITTERNDRLATQLAPFAEKHKIWVAFHNHTKNYPELDKVDPLMEIGDYIGFNFDIGHYVAGTGKSPIPVLEKYHDKIISLHLKDRTSDGGNVMWGSGRTPIKEVLQLLKKEKWPIYADIELEYRVPEGSDSVKEVARCFEYCKEGLA